VPPRKVPRSLLASHLAPHTSHYTQVISNSHIVADQPVAEQDAPPEIQASVTDSVRESDIVADHTMVTVSRRRATISKHAMVLYYNQNKQGIDVSDQMASYHTCLRRSIRWYHKVIVEILLGTAVVNAMILCNERRSADGLTVLKVTEFRELLCKGMLQSNDIDDGVDDRVAANHYLRETQLKEGGKRADRCVRRYCVGCYDGMSA